MLCVLFFRTNPLGMKGHIAQRYGDLVKDMWSGTTKTTAPLKLRVSIVSCSQHSYACSCLSSLSYSLFCTFTVCLHTFLYLYLLFAYVSIPYSICLHTFLNLYLLFAYVFIPLPFVCIYVAVLFSVYDLRNFTLHQLMASHINQIVAYPSCPACSSATSVSISS